MLSALALMAWVMTMPLHAEDTTLPPPPAGLPPGPAHADKLVFQGRDGVAIKGYDTVAYFTLGKPTRGDARYNARWRDATWLFASEAHRDLFIADPQRYAPQYGGYCAYGVSYGHTPSIDPAAFVVLDGKLFLNYSTDVNGKFLQKPAAHIKAADGHWARLSQP